MAAQNARHIMGEMQVGSASPHKMKQPLLFPIIVGGVVAGSLDLTSAFITFGFGVPRAIAAGLLGRQALHGGVGTVDFGGISALLHSLLGCNGLLCRESEARVPQASLSRLWHVLWHRGISSDELDCAATQRAASFQHVSASCSYPGYSDTHVFHWRADRFLSIQIPDERKIERGARDCYGWLTEACLLKPFAQRVRSKPTTPRLRHIMDTSIPKMGNSRSCQFRQFPGPC